MSRSIKRDGLSRVLMIAVCIVAHIDKVRVIAIFSHHRWGFAGNGEDEVPGLLRRAARCVAGE